MRLGINARFLPAAVTGVQRFAREITTRLCDLADVTLLVPRGVGPVGIGSARVRQGHLKGHVWEQLELPRLARAAGCDVTLHLSGTAPFQGGPHVLVIHDVLPLTNPEWYSRRFAHWYSAVLPRAVRRAAAVLTVSEHSRREILRVLGPLPRLALVTQGLAPFDRPAPADAIESVRHSLRLQERYLLAVRHGDPRKNHEFLLPVLGALRERGEDFELVIAGSASERVHGRRAKLVANHVRLLGHVSDAQLQALYTGASALCFPSLAEGFGRPPIEAATCGTPSLVADLPAVAEPGRTAGMPLPLLTQAWVDAIIAVTNDPAVRAAIVRRGLVAGENLSWDVAAREVLDICRVVAASRNANESQRTLQASDV